MFSLDPNTPSFLLEGETLTLSFSADAPQNDAFAIKWLIIPRGVLPVTFGPDGDFASHMGVYEVSAPAGASSFSFDIASLDSQRGGPDKDFVIELYEDKGADDDVFIGSAALRLNNDDEVAPRRVNVVGDGVGNSNVLVLGSNQDETLNGGTGDDLYVVTPHQYGNAIIQSGSGHNTIRLDYGVEIVDMSELVFDQTFNGQIPLETVREALGLPELTLEQAQNYPREVTVTIDGQLPSRIAPTSAISATVVEETALPSDGSIVTFAATAREGRTFTNWRVLEGGLDTGNFEVVDVAGGEQGVSATAGDYAFDFETVGSTVTLTIEGTDSADDVVSFTFTYTVTNVDEPVNFNNLLGDMSSLSVETPENQLINGSYVPINIDTGDTVAYSLTGVDQGLFSINSLTGELSWVNAPNHEASSGPFNVTIVATETPNGGGTNVANLPLVITVTNVNEAPLISTPDPLTVVFDSTATQVREIPVTDPDTGNSSGVSLAVTGAASYGDVTISQSGGVYSYHYNLDENDPDVTALINGNNLIDTFTVTATDGEGASTELDIDVTIDGISPQLIFPQGGGLSASLLENTDAPQNDFLNPFAVFEMVFVEGDDWDTLERLELDGVTPNYNYGLTASSQPENHRGIYMQQSRIRFDYEEQTEDHLLIRLTTDFGIVEDVVFTLNIINVQESVSWSNILQGEPSLAISTPENQLVIDTFYPVNIEEDFGDTVSFSLRGSHASYFTVDQQGGLSWAENPELAMGAGPYYVVIRATETYNGTSTRYSDLNLYVTLVAEDTGGAPMLMPEPFMADPYAEPDELLTAPPEPDPEVINIRPPEEPVAIEPYDEPEGIPVAPVEPVPIEPYDDDQQDYAVITPDIL